MSSRRHRDSFKRTSRRLPEKRTVLIVGEGRQTEPNYFRGLGKSLPRSSAFAIKAKKGHGRSPEAVVKEAIDYRHGAEERGLEYDEVWCMLDVERPSNRTSLNAAVALAEEEGITLCLSNPSFEVWLLSHFVKWARSYRDCDAVIVDLSRQWQKLCGRDYQKSDDRIYGTIGHLTRTAIENAQWVHQNHHAGKSIADANSSTEVYRLVSRLLEDSAPPQA